MSSEPPTAKPPACTVPAVVGHISQKDSGCQSHSLKHFSEKSRGLLFLTTLRKTTTWQGLTFGSNFVQIFRCLDHQIQYYWCQWSLFNSRLPKVCLFWVTTIDYQSPCDRQSYHKISSTWTLHPHSWIKERKINEMNQWNKCRKGNTGCEWSWWWESCPGCCDESLRKLKI